MTFCRSIPYTRLEVSLVDQLRPCQGNGVAASFSPVQPQAPSPFLAPWRGDWRRRGRRWRPPRAPARPLDHDREPGSYAGSRCPFGRAAPQTPDGSGTWGGGFDGRRAGGAGDAGLCPGRSWVDTGRLDRPASSSAHCWARGAAGDWCARGHRARPLPVADPQPPTARPALPASQPSHRATHQPTAT